MNLIETAKNIKMIAIGAVAVLAGVVIALLGALDVVALSIGRLALGSWAMYVAAVVVAGIGVSSYLLPAINSVASVAKNFSKAKRLISPSRLSRRCNTP